MIASAVKNTFNDIGTLDPRSDKIPKENAISVAEGIQLTHSKRVLKGDDNAYMIWKSRR